MSYRYTNTDKWCDAWFSNLKPLEKLLFNYLCDKCDIAGFVEVITKNWASDIGETDAKIKGALKGLQRGFIYSKDQDAIYLRTFLRHQKNLPLNPNNKSHVGILRRFDLFSQKFDIQNVDEFVQRGLAGGCKGLGRGTGNGIGNDNGIDSKEVTTELEVTKCKTWRDDYKIYLDETKISFVNIRGDKEFLKELEGYYPGMDILFSIDKSFRSYWGTEQGWRNKKKDKDTKIINWKATLIKTLTYNLVKK